MHRAEIRVTSPEDRKAIVGMVSATDMFRPCEVEIATEVLDDALEAGPEGHYKSRTAVFDGKPVGWVCWGRTPCAEGTWDIYWLVVDSSVRSRGLGQRLMDRAEEEIRGCGGRIAVVETSSRADYAGTRRFYVRRGYECCATVPDFYAPGDHKEILVRRLQPAP